MCSVNSLGVFYSVLFIVLIILGHYLLKRIRPEAFEHPENNYLAFLIMWFVVIFIVIIIGELAAMWCGGIDSIT